MYKDGAARVHRLMRAVLLSVDTSNVITQKSMHRNDKTATTASQYGEVHGRQNDEFERAGLCLTATAPSSVLPPSHAR
jgi:hypothetical protein